MDRQTKETLLIFPFLLLIITASSTEAMFQNVTNISSQGTISYTKRNRIYVLGNKLMVDGREIRLKGANLVGWDWDSWDVYWTDPDFYMFHSEARFQQMANYGMNVARLAVIQYTHWAEHPNKEAYHTLFDKAVQQASEYGIYTIITWGVWDADDPGITGMPKDKDKWITMWKEIASRYRDKWNVIYEIHNEPHSENHDVSNWWSWAQECINAIRQIDATVPIAVPLHNYATEAYSGPLKDGLLQGGNIFYDVHYYWWHYDSKNGERPDSRGDYEWVNSWFEDHTSSNARGHSIYALGQLAPIWIGEFGCRGQEPLANDKTWLTNMLRIINEQGWSYTYFAWWNGESFPMFQSGSWTQLTWQGQLIVNDLQRYPVR